MGRHAHITRLALGRSPFGEPLRDENGEFILGPHAHDNDAPGYVQQYDDRGHPQNRASKAAARRLRKAQNDILATVGVIIKKGEERKSKWERMDDNQKCKLVHDENRKGLILKAENRISGSVLSWYIVSLRRRLMTFNSYTSISLANLVAKEYHALGPTTLFAAGLPLYLSSIVPKLCQYYVWKTNTTSLMDFVDLWRNHDMYRPPIEALKWYSVALFSKCLEIPLQVYSTLKSLCIIPMSTGFDWKFLIPFAPTSPLCLPSIPANAGSSDILPYVFELLQTPLILYLIRDRLTTEVHFRLYTLLRQLWIKPDRPDALSTRAFNDARSLEGVSLADVTYREFGWRTFGPKSFFGALRVTFPPIYKFLNFLSRGRLGESRGRLNPSLNWLLQQAVIEKYWEEWSHHERPPRRGSTEDMFVRENALDFCFSRANLSPSEELVHLAAWTNLVLGSRAEGYRLQSLMRERSFNRMESAQSVRSLRGALPDLHLDRVVRTVLSEAFRMMSISDNVIIHTSDGPVVMVIPRSSTQPSHISDRDDVLSLDAPEVTVDTLLEGVRSLERAVQDALMTVQTEDPLRMQPATGVQEEEDNDDDEEAQEELHPDPEAIERPPTPPTPLQGISRAPSLAGPQFPPSLHRNPRSRRPTDTDDSLAALSQNIRARAENLPSPRPSQPEEENMSPITERYPEPLHTPIMNSRTYDQIRPFKRSRYRVTVLSNHLADSLAWHTSAVLSSFLLWPLEAFWLRSVADWALWNPAMGRFIDPWWAARLGFGVVGRPINVLSPWTWFGGAAPGDPGTRMGYLGNVLLTLGLEGIVRGVCWGVGVWRVGRCKGEYGWGQF